ncbi:Rieske 2Fe-2S domain-containing protein, partial [Streptomyces galilaeus]|uniref:Rieske 2Fe-2S domain-containing protein n=1 Tax=Streptomyces galilaeus TaxID=33899 RepID=UPI0038F7D853
NAARGNGGRLSCPYHFWSFGLDGALIAARGMPEGFAKAEHGLRPVAIENCGGLLFVCLADNPPPIDRVREDIAAQTSL